MAIDADLRGRRKRIAREATDELWRYLSRSATVGPGARIDAAARLANLAPDGLRRLSDVHFLLSEPVAEFLARGVPAILGRMARTTFSESATGLEVRGSIDWGATIAARAGSGWSVPTYAYLEASPGTDMPQNRVAKATLQSVREAAARVAADAPELVQSGAETALTDDRRWLSRGAAAGRLAAGFLRHPALARVGVPRHLSEHDLRAASRDRNRGYAAAVGVHRLRQALLERRDPAALFALMRERLLMPGQESRLFELWVLSRIARLFEARLGPPTSLPLLADGAKGPAYRFKTGGGETAQIYFQSAPSEIRQASRYREVFEAHSIDVATRVPDIVVQLGRGEDAPLVLIEAKASFRRTYIADGAYKLLGYLGDFGRALRPTFPDGPTGLLVALGGADRDEAASRAGHPIWITDVDRLDSDLAALFAPAFGG